MDRSTVALAVERAMSDPEKKWLLENFTRANPHWTGAEVADVLAEMDNADSHLQLVEDMYDAHADDFPDAIVDSGVLSYATRAVALSYGYLTVESAWPRVEDLIEDLAAEFQREVGTH